jgi:prepilin-type N-terminal cleavage/methylation domain-containing protein
MREARGFTLIEVLIVVLVISILALIVVPYLMGAARRGREAALQADLRELRAAVSLFQAHTGLYPAQLMDLIAPTAPATGVDINGVSAPIAPGTYLGPYTRNPDDGLPPDPITRAPDWSYSVTLPNVGHVSSSATGQTMDGVAYSNL